MEDAVESLVVEEESKKLMHKKSIFHRFRNKSTSDNNNGSDGKDSAFVSDKMTPNEVSKDTPVSTTGLNEDKDLADSSTIPNEECKDFPNNSTSPNEDSIDNKSKCNGIKEKILNGIREKSASSSQKSSSCLLLRLFESKLFDMSIAMSYLFKSKESGVQTYLGNKLFSLDRSDVDKYLPQLVNMYIHMEDVAFAVYHYFIERSKTDVEFAVQLSWLLEAHCADGWLPNREHQRGLKLVKKILEESTKQKYDNNVFRFDFQYHDH